MDELVKITEKLVEKLKYKSLCKMGIGYRYYHSMQVFQITKYINKKEKMNLDEKILYIIASFHDIKKNEKHHPDDAAEYFKKVINENKIQIQEEEVIIQGIRLHNKSIDNKNLYTMLIQYGDKLSKIYNFIPDEYFVDELKEYKISDEKIKKICNEKFVESIKENLPQIYEDNFINNK